MGLRTLRGSRSINEVALFSDVCFRPIVLKARFDLKSGSEQESMKV